MKTKNERTVWPKLLRMKQVTEYVSLSRAYLYQLIEAGEFPKGHSIAIGARVWERAEIDEWIDQKMGRAA